MTTICLALNVFNVFVCAVFVCGGRGGGGGGGGGLSIQNIVVPV